MTIDKSLAVPGVPTRAPADSAVKVLFIGGTGRSGSTVLANLLGQLDRFVSVGELSAIWNRGLLENRPCGCSRPFRECAFWQRVTRRYLEAPPNEIHRLLALRNGLLTIPVFRRLSRGKASSVRRDLEKYAEVLGDVYRSIQEATNCRVVVDSSKAPGHGYAAGLAQGVELYVVHLVRDPRAVAFSWQRRKSDGPAGKGGEMPRLGVKRSAFKWFASNAMCEFLWNRRSSGGRYMRLLYEDFVLDPAASLIEILRMLGEDRDLGFFSSPSVARLDRATHQVWGNPARFQSSEITIRRDDEWSMGLPARDRILTTTLTWPLLLRYGYRGSPEQGTRR